jgi:hypothetical protein
VLVRRGDRETLRTGGCSPNAKSSGTGAVEAHSRPTEQQSALPGGQVVGERELGETGLQGDVEEGWMQAESRCVVDQAVG